MWWLTRREGWNIEGLKLAYIRRVHQNQRKSRELKIKINRILFYFRLRILINCCVVQISLVFACLFFLPDDNLFLFGAIFFVLLSIVSMYYLMLSMKAYSKMRKKINSHRYLLSNNISAGNLKVLDLNKIEKLRRIIYELSCAMNLKKEVIVLRSSSKTYLPSIEEINGKVYLVLPMNFFSLIIKQPKRAKALIAHEFGHILQNDTLCWKDLVFYVKELQLTKKNTLRALPIIMIMISGFITMYFNGTLIGGLKIIFLTVCAVICVEKANARAEKIEDLLSYRTTSEELADMAAIIYADGNELCDCLAFYAKDERSNKIHPPRRVRINFIQKTMKDYNLT